MPTEIWQKIQRELIDSAPRRETVATSRIGLPPWIDAWAEAAIAGRSMCLMPTEPDVLFAGEGAPPPSPVAPCLIEFACGCVRGMFWGTPPPKWDKCMECWVAEWKREHPPLPAPKANRAPVRERAGQLNLGI